MNYYAISLSLITSVLGIPLLARTYEKNGGKMFPLLNQETFVFIPAYICLALISPNPGFAVLLTVLSTIGFLFPIGFTYMYFFKKDKTGIQETFPPFIAYPTLVVIWMECLSKWFESAAELFRM